MGEQMMMGGWMTDGRWMQESRDWLAEKGFF